MSGYFTIRYLRNDQPLQNYFFAVPQRCLGLMGIWPESMDKLQLRAFVHFVVLGIGVLTELHAGIQFACTNQLTLALETFCPAGTSAVTLLKMFLIMRYRRDLYYVIIKLRRLLFQHQWHSEEREAMMRRHAIMANRFNFWPLSAGFFTCTMYNSIPIAMAIILYIQGRSDEIVWKTPFNMTMPRVLLQTPYFPFTYLFIAYTGFITVFNFSGCDALYFEFCVHIATLFKSLDIDIRKLFQSYNGVEQLKGVQGAQFETSLVVLIKRQISIIKLTQFFRQRYWIITLAHFVSASLVIGFSIFLMLTMGGSGFGALLYIGYTVAALSQLFVYCYGGTLVAESSMTIATTMAICPWQICTPQHRRYIHLFILRSQRVLSMAVPFFSPSLVTFAAILQTSGSIIALAKSMQ